jgi:hypothetical protein
MLLYVKYVANVSELEFHKVILQWSMIYIKKLKRNAIILQNQAQVKV